MQLLAEKKKNYETRQELAQLKKRSKEDKKYRSLKSDFDHLLTQFKMSEQLRRE